MQTDYRNIARLDRELDMEHPNSQRRSAGQINLEDAKMLRVAYEYRDYLVERIAAIGDAQIDALNLEETVPYYTSSGCCDPIVQSGTITRYRIIEIDLPGWLIAGVARGQLDGRWTGCGSAEEVATKLYLRELSSALSLRLRQLALLKGNRGQAQKNKWVATGMI